MGRGHAPGGLDPRGNEKTARSCHGPNGSTAADSSGQSGMMIDSEPEARASGSSEPVDYTPGSESDLDGTPRFRKAGMERSKSCQKSGWKSKSRSANGPQRTCRRVTANPWQAP